MRTTPLTLDVIKLVAVDALEQQRAAVVQQAAPSHTGVTEPHLDT